MSAHIRVPGRIELTAALRAAGATIALAALAACQQGHGPRTVNAFMEDGLARDGVLARCNEDLDAAKQDVECENARRAAAAVAANAAASDQAREAALARESERKMLAMRERDTREQVAAEQAEAAVRAQHEAEYEAQWRAQSANGGAASTGEENGDDFDFVPARPALKVAAIEPPRGDLTIVAPELDTRDVAIIPRPFRTVTADNGAQPR